MPGRGEGEGHRGALRLQLPLPHSEQVLGARKHRCHLSPHDSSDSSAVIICILLIAYLKVTGRKGPQHTAGKKRHRLEPLTQGP